uniref:Uncharacterized protein n=1 Tax=Acrobeloides nanus TaxID=290746 RepID=A0A914DXJ3_9BILA
MNADESSDETRNNKKRNKTGQMLSMKILVSIFAMGGIFFLALNEKFTSEVPSNYDTILETEPPDLTAPKEEKLSINVLDSCTLPELDPWDSTIYKYLNPEKNPLKNCKKKINAISKLEEGKVVIDENFANVSKCAFRCLYPKTDYNLVYSSWKDVNSSEPDCDIVEVQCRSAATGTAFHKYLHAQIYAPEESPTFLGDGLINNEIENLKDIPDTELPQPPDVHIILIDSVSASQVFRSMPKTTHILREDYGAVPFKHVNKVGLNSRPNGFALLLDKYPTKPKFSISWMSYMAHDDANGLYHVDEDFYKLFKEYREKLKNSYIFLMSDHGHRFGSIRATKVGEVEDNNPFLYLVVPENKQNDKKFMEALQENSKSLVSHYDTYATFVEIANNSTWKSTKNLSQGETILHGSSFFHHLPNPRSCRSLRIPFEYCTCQFEKVPVVGPQEFISGIGEFMVSWLNKEIEKNNATKKCEVLNLDTRKEVKVQEFEPKSRLNIYQVTVKVNPSGGEFWGYAQKNFNISTNTTSYTMVSERMPRLNAYAGQSNCVSSNPRITPICYCKNLKGKPKVQETTR